MCIRDRGWFPWIFDQCHMAEHSTVLEIGCGDGSLWLENKEKIPKQLHVVLSDISEGMLRDTRRAIHANVKTSRFDFQVFDCERIPYPDKMCIRDRSYRRNWRTSWSVTGIN